MVLVNHFQVYGARGCSKSVSNETNEEKKNAKLYTKHYFIIFTFRHLFLCFIWSRITAVCRYGFSFQFFFSFFHLLIPPLVIIKCGCACYFFLFACFVLIFFCRFCDDDDDCDASHRSYLHNLIRGKIFDRKVWPPNENTQNGDYDLIF